MELGNHKALDLQVKLQSISHSFFLKEHNGLNAFNFLLHTHLLIDRAKKVNDDQEEICKQLL